jgi:serine/threonine protein phosphatase PrpC
MQKSPGTLEIRVGFATEQGRRPRNEDFTGTCFGAPGQRVTHGVIAAVADGMGGAKGGREAAETVVRGFIDGYYGQPETIGIERAAARTLESLNRWIVAQGRADPQLQGMATTFTALVLRGRTANVIHVGDSRLYRWSGNRLERLTEDHTHSHPDLSHVLYRAVGIEDNLRLDHAAHGLKLGDRFLLCSDGIHGALSDNHIGEILSRPTVPEASAQFMVEAALQAGSQDNVTAVVVEVVDLPPLDRLTLDHALAILPVSDLPSIGETIDGFLLEEILSSGRHSKLYRATDTMSGDAVVLKFPHPTLSPDSIAHEAFVREAWVSARVHSPWIGTVIEVPPERRTRLYSVMPYYEGETLEERLRRGPPVSVEAGIDIGIKLAKGVAALHRAGIVHRDIKPENILLQKGGGVKLLDLGVARLAKLEDAPRDDIPGTASFMAPELFAGEAGDELSDLFALGVTLYVTFTNAYPYGEIEPFSHPRFKNPAPLSQTRPDLPAWLDFALARAMAVKPADRFGDVLELAFELENGAARTTSQIIYKQPFYHRNPVRFWQVTSLILAAALLYVLMKGAA